MSGAHHEEIIMAVNNKQKLELTWIGKENRPRLEPRILLEDPEKTSLGENRQSISYADTLCRWHIKTEAGLQKVAYGLGTCRCNKPRI